MFVQLDVIVTNHPSTPATSSTPPTLLLLHYHLHCRPLAASFPLPYPNTQHFSTVTVANLHDAAVIDAAPYPVSFTIPCCDIESTHRLLVTFCLLVKQVTCRKSS